MEMINKIKELEQSKFSGNTWLKESVKQENKSANTSPVSGKMDYGRLYTFKYKDPKTKDKLAYWNTNPLVIKLDEKYTPEDGHSDICINLNFFPDKVKRQFIDVYWNKYHGLYESTTKKQLPPKDQRGVKFSFNQFNTLFNHYGIGFTMRRYILNRTSDMYVFSNDIDTWANAMLIKSPKFIGIGITERDKLFSKYINK